MLRSVPVQVGCKLAMLIVTAIVVAACGIKGPPVPPDRTPPVSVQDLRAVVDGENIRLDWSVPGAASEGKSRLEGFYVFRWRRVLDDADCPTCPRVYERIATIDIQSGRLEGGDRRLFTHESELEAGFRYSFKVMGYGPGGLVSGDSNLLNFDY